MVKKNPPGVFNCVDLVRRNGETQLFQLSGSQNEPDFIGGYPESYAVDTAAGPEMFQIARPHQLWTNSWNLQIDAVHTAACRDVERFAIAATPVQVRDDLRHEYRGDVFASRRENPHAPGSRAVQIPRLVYFDPVGTSFARIGCGIEEKFSLGQRAIRFHPVAHPGLLRLGIADVEKLLIGRKDDAIGPGQILDQKLQIFPLRRRAGGVL